MAITPVECVRLSPEEQKDCDALEKELDETLRHQFIADTQGVTIELGEEDASLKILKHLIFRYESCGWKVRPIYRGGCIVKLEFIENPDLRPIHDE